jgi:hypothetical protein
MVDRAALLILQGADQGRVLAELEKHATPRQAKKAIDEAGARIAVAANFDKAQQVGVSIRRLNDLFSISVESGEVKTALAAQKELNKIMDLYAGAKIESGKPAADNSDAERELATVVAHLAPMDIAKEGTPAGELARIAAAIIRNG